MSFDGTIQRNGVQVSWTPMGGTNRIYDTSTGTMIGGPDDTVSSIYVIVDGFMSTAGKVRSDAFDRGTLVTGGLLNCYTTAPVGLGDRLTIDGNLYTVMFRKSIWRKNKPVLYLLQVAQ